MNAKNWVVGRLEQVADTSSIEAATHGHNAVTHIGTGLAFVAFAGGVAGFLSSNPIDPIVAGYGGVMAGFSAAFLMSVVSSASIMAFELETKAERAAVALRDGARLALEKMTPTNDSKALSLFSALTTSAVEVAQRPTAEPEPLPLSKPVKP